MSTDRLMVLAYTRCNEPAKEPDCDGADLDADGDVDLTDFGVFQGCFNGPNRPPMCE